MNPSFSHLRHNEDMTSLQYNDRTLIGYTLKPLVSMERQSLTSLPLELDQETLCTSRR